MTYALNPASDSFSNELGNSFFEDTSSIKSLPKNFTNSNGWEKKQANNNSTEVLKEAISTPNQTVYDISDQDNPNNGLSKDLMKDNTFSENYFLTQSNVGMVEVEIDTIPDETYTKPINDLLTKAKAELDKKVRALLSQKVVYFEKQLECYGVIDNIYLEHKTRLIDARIYDINTNKIIDNITFEAKEFPKSDQGYLSENSVFYWRVGKDHHLFGGHRKVSDFRLRRRVIKLSPAQLKQKQQDINDTINFFESIIKK
ncbi:hypothetical protein BFV65_11590 [Enterobacter hormaechei subsp. hoffmannii]|uniref:hypothetical protein n=1 Tax=Enterobacter TaxID=547 RepID=UPI00084C706A|nr:MULTISPECIES: hypothetical protein [Enterobacter]AOQ00227.1 hypothetical protein BFV65_11590 [Enterobacter hormaechei subsp. hoffmannii]MBA7750662.1 hypothetical protein [Enterobacter sp. RHBSTW-01064]MCK7178791.1 hypothetical protein [Enterobacter roggenkampii]HEP0853302.1 hypothetical protein [Enterobacter asburiae]